MQGGLSGFAKSRFTRSKEASSEEVVWEIFTEGELVTRAYIF